jgi:hypothetical protein
MRFAEGCRMSRPTWHMDFAAAAICNYATSRFTCRILLIGTRAAIATFSYPCRCAWREYRRDRASAIVHFAAGRAHLLRENFGDDFPDFTCCHRLMILATFSKRRLAK